jgi:hypothetical protein
LINKDKLEIDKKAEIVQVHHYQTVDEMNQNVKNLHRSIVDYCAIAYLNAVANPSENRKNKAKIPYSQKNVLETLPMNTHAVINLSILLYLMQFYFAILY